MSLISANKSQTVSKLSKFLLSTLLQLLMMITILQCQRVIISKVRC